MDRYTERQNPQAWIYVIMGAAALFSCTVVVLSDPRGRAIVVPVLAVWALLLGLLSMRTTVDNKVLTVSFGTLFTWYRRRIPLSEIASAEVVSYSPIKEYGGWGIRGIGKHRALNMQGNRGVQLVLRNGDHVLIGSGHPEELHAALQAAR
jgi:hypothetical protein